MDMNRFNYVFPIANGGQGGGGAQADWSVNDPNAEGYVKNRTHYEYAGSYETIVIDKLILSNYEGQHIIIPDVIEAYKISDDVLLTEEQILASYVSAGGVRSEKRFEIIDTDGTDSISQMISSLGCAFYQTEVFASIEDRDLYQSSDLFTLIVVPYDISIPDFGLLRKGMYVSSSIIYSTVINSVTISDGFIETLPTKYIKRESCSYVVSMHMNLPDKNEEILLPYFERIFELLSFGHKITLAFYGCDVDLFNSYPHGAYGFFVDSASLSCLVINYQGYMRRYEITSM